mmetsp:Transcript_23952/g.66584  ORF Transcript_23952/g.66584 Transcript_23952/m.66584 type:complete len:231 (+) Transcript_23952:1037-1729(+)
MCFRKARWKAKKFIPPFVALGKESKNLSATSSEKLWERKNFLTVSRLSSKCSPPWSRWRKARWSLFCLWTSRSPITFTIPRTWRSQRTEGERLRGGVGRRCRGVPNALPTYPRGSRSGPDSRHSMLLRMRPSSSFMSQLGKPHGFDTKPLVALPIGGESASATLLVLGALSAWDSARFGDFVAARPDSRADLGVPGRRGVAAPGEHWPPTRSVIGRKQRWKSSKSTIPRP